MARPSLREQRRREIVLAFAKVVAQRGVQGATVALVATEAGIAPGLVHHHFSDKDDMIGELVHELVSRFRTRVREQAETDRISAYITGALQLDERADVVAARCWVAIFAESLRNPKLFARARNLIDGEITALEHRSEGTLSRDGASAVLAYVVGALVLGAFAPRKTAGFAAPGLRKFVDALRA